MKYIILSLIFLTSLLGQKFSPIESSEVTFLDMDIEDNKNVFIDEGSLLVWQNSLKLPHFKNLSQARKYCKNLTLEDYSWHLPTQSELFSLSIENVKPSMNPKIRWGRNRSYLAHDGPIWDKRLHFGFDFNQRSVLVFNKQERNLYVRCAASLE